ncbi:class I SAM-dependent methyltransferase [Aureimonas sp. N4]|uniref:class I SAM-dependent methyltransferase n=1 Tax=Aureimonas sp. N4 TaxID=1638165 RepID=UPI00078494E9|nr:methyltransferase [Aureimonas sp. N4]
MTTATADRRAFILANTSRLRPPHVPELELHLASEVHDLWIRTEEELEAEGLPPPFWAFAWAGGQGLARFVLDHPDRFASQHVVDFATGSGLVAIAAMKAGAAEALGLDIDPFAVEAARLNAEHNGVALTLERRDAIGEALDTDILLAGDVFYDPNFSLTLEPWFDRLAASGVEIYVGDPGRFYLPHARVIKQAVYEVPVTRILEDAEVKRTTVWRWRAD